MRRRLEAMRWLDRELVSREGLKRVAERSREARERLARWREDRAGPEGGSPEDDGGWVRWAEAYVQSVALHATPLSIASIFKRQIGGRPRAWIFTSATLAMGGDFSHFIAELGLDGAKTARWESPFDYAGHGFVRPDDRRRVFGAVAGFFARHV